MDPMDMQHHQQQMMYQQQMYQQQQQQQQQMMMNQQHMQQMQQNFPNQQQQQPNFYPQQMQQPHSQTPQAPQPSQKDDSKDDDDKPEPELDNFQLLEKKLDEFQETARHIGVITSDFQTRNQETLNGKIYSLIHGLQEMDRMKNQFSDVKVPLEMLEFLDNGKNPLLYSKQCMERTLEKNKAVNGKIEIYKKFRAHLLNSFGEEMPDLVMKYRNYRDEVDLS